MGTYTVEIHPQNAANDPQAQRVKAELIEEGVPAATATVQTCRLYRIQGDFTLNQIESIAQVLLVDPVIEKSKVTDAANGKNKKGEKLGWILDVWPKLGVTDPVGETVEKGLRDLGYKGAAKATSAQRYIFPKIKESKAIKTVAKRFLANELVNDIDIRKIN